MKKPQTLLLAFLALFLTALPAVSLVASSPQLLDGKSPIDGPYAPLHGGAFVGPVVPGSPDPLANYRWDSPRASDELQEYLLRPTAVSTDQAGSFEDLSSAMATDCQITVKGTGSIRFDFGTESAGWLEFDSSDLTGNVELSISEYNEPGVVSTGPENWVKTAAPVKHGQTYRLELNKSLYEGVRFGWIHVRTFDKPWRITAVRLVCQVKPINYEGSFDCSDPLLTRVWYAGAYGVKLNLLKNDLGAILMDRGDRISWTGDDYAAQAAILAAFGGQDLVKASLERTAKDNNGIESYSLYWVLSLMDYFRYSGDVAALRQYADLARAKLDHANVIYANPQITFYGWGERLGAGFEEPNSLSETKNALRMVFIRACREFAEGLRAIGQSEVAEKYEKMADGRVAELKVDPEWTNHFGLHAGADAVNAGFTSLEEQARLLEREFSDRATRVSFSPFNQYFVIQAMARMRRYDEALAAVRDDWGGQLAYGGTTFFETFWPAWTQALGQNDALPNCQSGYTSLCHPWSSGVTNWLTEETLGIKPRSPGFATYDVLPHLGRTLTSVSGSVPTPQGTLRAAFDVTKGKASLVAPPNTLGCIGIPKVERTIEKVLINGALAWDGTVFHAVSGIGGASADPDFVIFDQVQPGTYEMQVTYTGATTPPFQDAPWQFPTTFVKEDRTTGGDWGGKYGRDGSVLFGVGKNGGDRIQLPGYVKEVTKRRGRTTQWPGPGGQGALAEDSTNAPERRGGVLYSGAPGDVDRCVVVDVALKHPAKYQLSLYFVDLDRKGRRQSLELFDLDSRKLIAPTRIYADFTGGTYAIYECRQSVRVRVNHVRGDNAVLSGIFFDANPDQ